MAIAEKIQNMVGITPSHSDEEREQIRQEARGKATTKWFSLVLDHHMELEKLFAKVKAANSSTARAAAQKELAVLITGHSIAEEAIIYPAMKIETSSMDAIHAFAEQAMAKVKMVELDNIADKMSKVYSDKLEEIRSAVLHHMIEEEQDYFPELQDKSDSSINKKISEHYQSEFNRYVQKSA
jgi:iron-sulfur cluster repair protein YtfE (RIC family)